MNPEASPNRIHDDVLSELADLGMRMARVVVRLGEAEQAAVDIVTWDMPKAGVQPGSAAEAHAAGASLDGLAAWMAGAVPRVDLLARALERISRSVRRSVALAKRIDAGWPRVRSADDRPAMIRRQVKQDVSEVIRRVTESDDTAERLFDELYERLEDPGFEQEMFGRPVTEIVRRFCRDLGLAAGDSRAVARDAAPAAGVLQPGRLPRATHGPPRT